MVNSLCHDGTLTLKVRKEEYEIPVEYGWHHPTPHLNVPPRLVPASPLSHNPISK